MFSRIYYFIDREKLSLGVEVFQNTKIDILTGGGGMGDNDALDWLKRRAEKKQSPSFGFNSSAQTSTNRLGH